MNRLLLLSFLIFSYARAEEESKFMNEQIKTASELIQTGSQFMLVASTKSISDYAENITAQCPDIDRQMELTFKAVTNCIGEMKGDTLCSLMRNNFEKCVAPLTNKFEECLPQESKGLPVMMAKMLKAELDRFCTATMDEAIEMANFCLQRKNYTSLDSCEKANDAFTEYSKKFPSKASVCGMIPVFKSCLNSVAEVTCDNPVSKRIVLSYFEPVEQVAASECADLNQIKLT